MNCDSPDHPGSGIVSAILELLRRFEAGEVASAALSVRHADGSSHDILLGFAAESDGDAAIAKLQRILGQLH